MFNISIFAESPKLVIDEYLLGDPVIDSNLPI